MVLVNSELHFIGKRTETSLLKDNNIALTFSQTAPGVTKRKAAVTDGWNCAKITTNTVVLSDFLPFPAQKESGSHIVCCCLSVTQSWLPRKPVARRHNKKDQIYTSLRHRQRRIHSDRTLHTCSRPVDSTWSRLLVLASISPFLRGNTDCLWYFEHC